jgi:hypothetical protein
MGEVVRFGLESVTDSFQPWHLRGLYCHTLALLVMGFPGAVECCNCIAAYLKGGLQLSP